jgi:predicted enzyme related to lactoylglutathione lyase
MIDSKSLVQLEIHVSDLPKSIAFYEQVFGWRQVPAELHNYVVLEVNPSCPWGISLVPSSRVSSNQSLVLYFAATDARGVADKAVLLGGQKRFGPTRLPAYGEIWQIADPDGHWFGLFEASER